MANVGSDPFPPPHDRLLRLVEIASKDALHDEFTRLTWEAPSADSPPRRTDKKEWTRARMLRNLAASTIENVVSYTSGVTAWKVECLPGPDGASYSYCFQTQLSRAHYELPLIEAEELDSPEVLPGKRDPRRDPL